MKIDLQMHSTFSDGHETPSELVALAARYEVTYMALTDHDMVDGLSEAFGAGKKFGVKVISGVELTTIERGRTLHILGYAFDSNNPELGSLCACAQEDRKRVFLAKTELINEQFRAAGKPIIDVDDFRRSQGKFFGLGKLLNYAVRRGIVETKGEMSALWSSLPKMPLIKTSPVDAIKIIHAAGGVAVLSHPFAPKLSLKNSTSSVAEQDALVRALKEQGLDGIECYQPSHGVDDVEHALILAHELNLLVTGGTDWHGPIEVVGEQVREYIPYYANHIGDLTIPPKHVRCMIERLT